MSKKKIQAFVSEETNKAIEEKAKKERRSISNTASIMLDDAVANLKQVK